MPLGRWLAPHLTDMSSNYRNPNGESSSTANLPLVTKDLDGRARHGPYTTSTKPVVYQAYEQPATSDYDPRRIANTIVPRSHGSHRSDQNYRDTVAPVHSRRGDTQSGPGGYLPNQHPSSTTKVAGRRDSTVRFEEPDRRRDVPERNAIVSGSTRHSDPNEHDSDSEVNRFYGANPSAQNALQRRGSESHSRQGPDSGYASRRPSEHQRRSSEKMVKIPDTGVEPERRSNYQYTLPDPKEEPRKGVLRHAKDQDHRGLDQERIGTGRTERSAPNKLGRHDVALEDSASSDDTDRFYGARRENKPTARRKSSPSQRERGELRRSQDVDGLTRQSTRQSDAIATRRHRSDDPRSHIQSRRSQPTNEARVLFPRDRHNKSSDEDNDRRRMERSSMERKDRDDRLKLKQRQVAASADSDSDEVAHSRRTQTGSRHQVQPTSRHAVSHDKDDSSLPRAFKGLMLKRGVSGKPPRHAPGDDDDDSDDDVNRGYGARHISPNRGPYKDAGRRH